MTAKLDDLLTRILSLPPWERRQLLERLAAAESEWVREGEATYQSDAMRFVTVALPDELAKQAQEAGLLGNKTLEAMLRRALRSHDGGGDGAPAQQRRLLERNGYLVAEALPGEKRITSDEVRSIIDNMEW